MLSRLSDRGAHWGRGDPLSSVLFDLRLSGTFFCNSDFGAPWSLQIAERDFASFHFVARGECWLQAFAKGRANQAVQLGAGDLVLLPRSPRQVFASSKRTTGASLDKLPVDQLTEHAAALHVGGRRGPWRVVCGGVRLEGFAAMMLVDLMPVMIVLRKAHAHPIVERAIEAMQDESANAQPGGATVMARLADVVVIHALRSWIETSTKDLGWIAALRDPQIGRAITKLHAEPDQRWSVEALARAARLSRSRFSERFTELAGIAPMQYVKKVQMHRASELLAHDDATIAELAQRFGYDSEPAFARAFKRHVGQPPGAVRRAARRDTQLRW